LRSRFALWGSCHGRCSWSRGIVAVALAGSSWSLVRAHGIIAIASAICWIPHGHNVRLVEFIAIAVCKVADT
jgi:hypothetical protein